MNKLFIKKAISVAFYNLYGRFNRTNGNRTLLYHSVGSKLDNDTYGISISPYLFIKHLDLINGTYKVVPFSAKEYKSGSLSITFDDGYKDNLLVAAPELLRRGMPFTVFVTTSYIQSGDPIYLSCEHLKELASFDGVTIGSHGITHARLAECDDKTLKKELCESRSYLEDIIGKPVTSVSYPHGSVDRRVRDAAQDAGYTIGGCSLFGVNKAGCDPLLLRRTEIVAEDSEKILLQKIKGAWDWYAWRQKGTL